MKKLYEKNELFFSLFWIFVYVLGASIADGLSSEIGIEKSATLPFLAALSLGLFVWIRNHGLMKKYGLCPAEIPSKAMLYYLPLVFVASCNLWLGITRNMPPLETVLYVLSMLLVGFLEELIFRGLLFRAMAADNLKSAVIVSSVTFGIGHIVNLFNGSGMDLLSNVLQIFYAVVFGFLFVVILLKTGSLIPCILTHSVLNALSAIAVPPPSPFIDILITLILTVVSAVYILYLIKKLPPSEVSHAD